MWAYLEPRHLDPNAPAKFGLALLQISAGFFVLVWGAQNFAGEDFRVPMIFLFVLAYLLHTTGELCLSPVGLSQMTKLSPPATVATIMATWFLALGLGGLSRRSDRAPDRGKDGRRPSPRPRRRPAEPTSQVFTSVAMWGTAIGVVLLVASPFLGRLDRASSEGDVRQRAKPAAGE